MTKKRMETVDDETAAAAMDFIERQHKAGKPMFVWVNFTHMHFRTHPKPASIGQSGRWQSEYHDAMIDHDKNVGTVLQKLDELGIADNTIVVLWSDHGWQLGEKKHWRKFALWENVIRCVLMVRVPPGTAAMPVGSARGKAVNEPTSLGLLAPPGACGADIAVGEGTGIGVSPR